MVILGQKGKEWLYWGREGKSLILLEQRGEMTGYNEM